MCEYDIINNSPVDEALLKKVLRNGNRALKTEQ